MEKRSFTRQALHHLGHLSSPQQNPIPCILKDFCKSGLFIAFHDDHPEQHRPLSLNDSLFVDFKSSGILQLNYRLHVRVARIMDGAIGVQITHDNPEAIHALYKLAKEPAVKTSPVSHQDYAKLKEKCRELVEAFAISTDKALFEAIDEELHNRADHAKDNKQSSAYIDTASRFKKYQNRIADSFKHTLKQEVDNWLTGQPVSLPESMPSENPKALSLVEKDDFEDWLLVKVVINRADQHYKETLYDLQLRMTELTGTEVNHKKQSAKSNLYQPRFLPRHYPLGAAARDDAGGITGL